MTLKLITGPASEPLTLDEAKLHLRVDHSADDALITSIIVAARQGAEHLTGRALITQTWELALDAFPVAGIAIARAGVQAITSVTYVDVAGATQTLASNTYSLDAETTPAWLLPAIDTTWPDTLDTANALRVRFTCGYGDAASDVPDGIKAWMRLQIGAMYAQREAFVVGKPAVEIPGRFVDALLDPYRVWLL